jgi:Fcf2 pre-rRNA processing
MGTIIESPTEYFSARLKKKDRKETIVESLADQQSREYFKRKYQEIQDKAASGGENGISRCRLEERKNRF